MLRLMCMRLLCAALSAADERVVVVGVLVCVAACVLSEVGVCVCRIDVLRVNACVVLYMAVACAV